MKRILTSTALVMAMSTAAFAAIDREKIENALSEYGYDVNMSVLTEAQLEEFAVLFNQSNESPARTNGRIDEILDDGGPWMVAPSDDPARVMVAIPANSMRAAVQNTLDSWGMEHDVYELTRQEASDLYIMINSSSDATEAQNKVKQFYASK